MEMRKTKSINKTIANQIHKRQLNEIYEIFLFKQMQKN